jgi:hypothetical protein
MFVLEIVFKFLNLWGRYLRIDLFSDFAEVYLRILVFTLQQSLPFGFALEIEFLL